MTSAPLNLFHRLRLPPRASAPVPAVIMVHGWRGNERVMAVFERTLPEGVALVSPRGPVRDDDNAYGWYARGNAGEGSSAGEFTAGLDALETFVRGLPEAYPLDPARLWLMGFSQGAAMCFSLLLRAPELAAGVAGLAGFLPRYAWPWAEAGRLSGQPVFIAHGTEDETVPVDRARRARDALRTAGANVTYREYATGHKLNAEGMRDLKQWMARAADGARP